MSPVLKSVLEAGAAYPLLRELLSFAKVDQDKLGEKVQGVLNDLSSELGGILKKEEGENAGNGVAIDGVAPEDITVLAQDQRRAGE
jgi:hypothetical protein